MPASTDPALSASILILHGNDEFRVDERARALLKARCPQAETDGSLSTIRGDVEVVDDALEALKQTMTAVQSANLFNPLNVTWLRDVMFLSGPAFKSADVKESIESFQELLGAGLDSGQVLLITVSGKLSAASRFAKAIKAVAHVEEFQKTTKEWEVADEAKQLIQGRARELGVEFRPDALNELAERVGNDTRQLMQEVEKLSLCREEAVVEKADVELMVPLHQEAQAWKLSDCIGNRDLSGAMSLLQRMETQGASPVAAIAMLHNSLREMTYLGCCLHQGSARLEERGRSGSFTFTDPEAESGFLQVVGDKKRSPFRLYQLGRQGKRFSVKQLDRMLRLSADTYDGFFRRPLSHFEQLRLLLLRIFHESGSPSAS